MSLFPMVKCDKDDQPIVHVTVPDGKERQCKVGAFISNHLQGVPYREERLKKH